MAGFKRYDMKMVSFDRYSTVMGVLETLTEILPEEGFSSRSWLGSVLKRGLQVLGFIMASLIFLANSLNFKNFLSVFLGDLAVALTFTFLLSIGSIYTLNILFIGALGQVFEYLNAKINGHNYWSPSYNLFPKLTLFTLGFAAVWSLISYPTIKALLTNNYFWPEKIK